MNINFGLFPPIDFPMSMNGKRLRGKEKSRARKQAMAKRALSEIDSWLAIQSGSTINNGRSA